MASHYCTEEIERRSALPHRGRLVELPGSVMPGQWTAILLKDASSKEYGNARLASLRITLRHHSASAFSPLENYHAGEEAAPDGHTVSLADPSINRVASFARQGAFTEDEEGFRVEGEERMLNGSYLGCLSVATFAGFLSSSECTNGAGDVSGGILARCVRSASTTPDAVKHELLKIAGEENGDVMGILFPCRIDFDYKYSLLMLHDAKCRVIGMDGEQLLKP